MAGESQGGSTRGQGDEWGSQYGTAVLRKHGLLLHQMRFHCF